MDQEMPEELRNELHSDWSNDSRPSGNVVSG